MTKLRFVPPLRIHEGKMGSRRRNWSFKRSISEHPPAAAGGLKGRLGRLWRSLSHQSEVNVHQGGAKKTEK